MNSTSISHGVPVLSHVSSVPVIPPAWKLSCVLSGREVAVREQDFQGWTFARLKRGIVRPVGHAAVSGGYGPSHARVPVVAGGTLLLSVSLAPRAGHYADYRLAFFFPFAFSEILRSLHTSGACLNCGEMRTQ